MTNKLLEEADELQEKIEIMELNPVIQEYINAKDAREKKFEEIKVAIKTGEEITHSKNLIFKKIASYQYDPFKFKTIVWMTANRYITTTEVVDAKLVKKAIKDGLFDWIDTDKAKVVKSISVSIKLKSSELSEANI